MSELRTFTCGLPECNEVIKTTDKRKMYCSKKHADNARNRVLPAPVPLDDSIVADLTKFGKLPPEEKQAVLLGERGHRIGFFDIEATHLKPNVGRILCTSFVDMTSSTPHTFQALERRFKEEDVYNDGKLATAVRNELEGYDIIAGWNSKQFDVKFVNSRCVRVGERIKDAQYHVDGMWSWRSKFNAWSGLDAVQNYALPNGENVKTKIAWDKWMQALGWNKALREQAMAEIVDHCEKDVLVLRDVYTLIVKNNVVRSIRKDGGIL
jgi:uncharacterized protein YprB with RNaseH-like and TPR domain